MPNHLGGEKSPYLLQHANNPVDWYPWGQEAFEKAKSEEKPIFLSIGYATCHWCHVMERESFEDPLIALALNEAFVCIKVDREELPQVDSLYMEFAQALMASSGGWPLNMILTPDLKPFFAVTYLPPKARHGLIGFDQFIQQIKQLWASEEKALLIEQADQLVETFSRIVPVAGTEMPGERDIKIAEETLFELSDATFGGMKGSPKFPLSYQLEFLMQEAKSTGDSRALFYVELTLDAMQRGGIYDHLGGGFSRYSVDEKWHIPHFEKMLYDNALLAKTYLEAWKCFKKPKFRDVVEETLRFLLREMQNENGGFYSGQDAETDGHEGLYYTWTPEEIRASLSPEEAEIFCLYYNVTREGNFEGRNVLLAPISPEEFAEMGKISRADLASKLKKMRQMLLEKRLMRKRPFRDEKILTCWNGLMIDLLVRAGFSLGEAKFTEAAQKTVGFLKRELWRDGRLLRRWCDQEARFPAVLEDYAFLIKGLITLFTHGLGNEHLEWALELALVLERHFKAPQGAFFQTEEEVVLRKCDFYDGAEPSGNGVHAENLVRLYQITHNKGFLSQAEDILKAAKNHLETYPPGACWLLLALQRYLNPKAPTVVVALDEKESLLKEIQGAFAPLFSPHLETIWKKEKKIDMLLPEEKEKTPLEGKTAVYICRQNMCEPAYISKEEIEKAIQGL